jgi:hypothetical protein
MTFQAYLDTVKAKTGKTPDDFRKLAQQKGLTKSSDIRAWLKEEFGLGHGHAQAIVHVLESATAPKVTAAEKIDAHFAGKKAVWRKPYDTLLAKVSKFGGDVSVSTTRTYLSLLRGDKKFAIVAPATPERLDIGIKLKGVPPAGRLEAAGTWNNMVTHRVRIADPKEINAELLAWLKQAYEAA